MHKHYNMKWYDIEYSGGKSSKNVTGQSALDLDEVLNTTDPPKFIKIQNMSYYSKLSEQYELFEKWDSKWENEIWINTSSIISIRKVKDNLHGHSSTGEWNAFTNKIGASLIISKKLVDSLTDKYESVFLEKVHELTRKKYKQLAYLGQLKINTQELLDENEFIFHQHGNIVIRKKVEGDVSTGIINELDKYFSQFNQSTEEED